MGPPSISRPSSPFNPTAKSSLEGRRPKYQVLESSGDQINVDDFVLVRYNQDGTLDTSFGTGGEVITDLGGDAVLGGIVVQPDGKILAVGSLAVPVHSGDPASIDGSETDLVVARYNPDGSLDTTFGNGGVVTLANPGFNPAILPLPRLASWLRPHRYRAPARRQDQCSGIP